MIIIYFFSYFSFLVFIILIINKIRQYSGTPLHLRWDLYPIAHERERNKYGGSYYEEPDWWNKRNKKSRLSELLEVLEEIFFLKGVYHHNKKLWYYTFPFHLGLYLITGSIFLIISSIILDISSSADIFWQNNTAEYILFYLINTAGYTGMVLTFSGCLGLILERLTEKKYRFYNAPMDFINLFFILGILITGMFTIEPSNSSFILYKIYLRNLFTFNFTVIAKPVFLVHISLVSAFLLYFPVTRMRHLFAKYFTYHRVRWEDNPNLKGGKLDSKIRESLNFRVSWSAPHINAGNNWAETSAKLPPEVKNVE